MLKFKTELQQINCISKKTRVLLIKAREIQRRLSQAPPVGSFFFNHLKKNQLNPAHGIAVSREAIVAVLKKRPISVFSNPSAFTNEELRRIHQFNASFHFPLQPETIWRILELEYEMKREAELKRRTGWKRRSAAIHEMPSYNPNLERQFSNLRISAK